MDAASAHRVETMPHQPADETRPNVVVWDPDEGERLWVFPRSQDDLGPGGEFHIYVDPSTYPDGSASFARFALGAGGDLAEHRHERSEELAYLLSGDGAIKRRERSRLVEVPIRAGSAWYIPPGAWHSVKNTGTDPLVMVFATVPNLETGLLSFFRRIGTLPGHEPNRLSKAEIARIGADHDFVVRTPLDEP
jgi:mannose-6-phosphate isomerase-like protein (cupin superfamily)